MANYRLVLQHIWKPPVMNVNGLERHMRKTRRVHLTNSACLCSMFHSSASGTGVAPAPPCLLGCIRSSECYHQHQVCTSHFAWWAQLCLQSPSSASTHGQSTVQALLYMFSNAVLTVADMTRTPDVSDTSCVQLGWHTSLAKEAEAHAWIVHSLWRTASV